MCGHGLSQSISGSMASAVTDSTDCQFQHKKRKKSYHSDLNSVDMEGNDQQCHKKKKRIKHSEQDFIHYTDAKTSTVDCYYMKQKSKHRWKDVTGDEQLFSTESSDLCSEKERTEFNKNLEPSVPEAYFDTDTAVNSDVYKTRKSKTKKQPRCTSENEDNNYRHSNDCNNLCSVAEKVNDTFEVPVVGDWKPKKRKKKQQRLMLDDNVENHENSSSHSPVTEGVNNAPEVNDNCKFKKKRIKKHKLKMTDKIISENTNVLGSDKQNVNRGVNLVNNEELTWDKWPSNNCDDDQLRPENFPGHSDGHVSRHSDSEKNLTVDDIDHDDESFAVPAVKPKRRVKSRKNLMSMPPHRHEGDRNEDTDRKDESVSIEVNVRPLYNTSSYLSVDENRNTVFRNDQQHSSHSSDFIIPGFFRSSNKKYKTSEELYYKFPKGFGIPPEMIEDIPEQYNYWKRATEKLVDKSFKQEDIENEVMGKIKYVQDYFDRLERGSLTKKELKEVRPRNFDEPYLPTPQHLDFLKNLDIKIDWPVSAQHQRHLDGKSNVCVDDWDSFTDFENGTKHTRFKDKEDKVVLQNWIRFQEEYKFYDLRPLLSVRTTRIANEGNDITFRSYQYISSFNIRKFLLYLTRGIDDKPLPYLFQRIKYLVTYIRDNKLEAFYGRMTGRMLAKIEFMLKRFGNNYLGMELLIGFYTYRTFAVVVQTRMLFRNINLRTGSWTENEEMRLKKGLYDLYGITRVEEVRTKKISWIDLLPYVRTRHPKEIKQHVLRSLEFTDSSKFQNKIDTVKIIELVYESGVDHLFDIDWQAIGRHFPGKHPKRQQILFQTIYYRQVSHRMRSSFKDAMTHLFNKYLPVLKAYCVDNSPSCEGGSGAEGQTAANTGVTTSYLSEDEEEIDDVARVA